MNLTTSGTPAQSHTTRIIFCKHQGTRRGDSRVAASTIDAVLTHENAHDEKLGSCRLALLVCEKIKDNKNKNLMPNSGT